MEFKIWPGYPLLFLRLFVLDGVVLFLILGYYRFSVNIDGQFRIVQKIGHITHNVKCHSGSDVEKLPVLADPQIRQPVYLLVNLLFNLAVFAGVKRGVNLKRQWNRSVVQFLRANIHRT